MNRPLVGDNIQDSQIENLNDNFSDVKRKPELVNDNSTDMHFDLLANNMKLKIISESEKQVYSSSDESSKINKKKK